MLQHSEEQQAEKQTKTSVAAIATSVLGSIRIDLVKALLLGLTLQEACALSVVHQLINKELAAPIDIDDQRWWAIDGVTLYVFAEGVASHPKTGTKYLLALRRKGLIEIGKVETL